MATKLASPPTINSKSLTDPRHLMRYMKQQGGMTNAEIAKAEGVSVDTVSKSILLVERYRARTSRGEMDFAVRDLVISTIPQAKVTLHGLLTATELVERKNEKTGKTDVVAMPDKVTQLEAVKVVRGLIADQQPKTPPVEVNVNQTNQTANISSSTETNEERFRRLREKAKEHNALPPEVAAVPDYIDAGDESEEEEDDDEDEE